MGPGTVVHVTNLKDDVSAEFNDYFISELKERIKSTFREALEKGLVITLNGIPIISQPFEFAFSDTIKPIKYETVLGEKDKEVHMSMYLGITKRNPHTAGFYIFCNGQLILEADKFETTGWDDKEKSLPQYHNDFAYFKGAIFFSSDYPNLLPWDTTKSRINTDSGIYKATKLEMVKRTKPFLEFLRKLAYEKKKNQDDTPLNDLVTSSIANSVPISDLTNMSDTFQEPEVEEEKEEELKKINIKYAVLEERYKKVKKKLDVKTIKEVGIGTFDYYFDNEIDGGN